MAGTAQRNTYFAVGVIGFTVALAIFNVLSWIGLWIFQEEIRGFLSSVDYRIYYTLCLEFVGLSIAIYCTLAFFVLPSALQNCRMTILLTRTVLAVSAAPLVVSGIQAVWMMFGENSVGVTMKDVTIASVLSLLIVFAFLAYFNGRYDELVRKQWAQRRPGL